MSPDVASPAEAWGREGEVAGAEAGWGAWVRCRGVAGAGGGEDAGGGRGLGAQGREAH